MDENSNSTYSSYSHICCTFYDLVFPPSVVANFITSKISPFSIKKALFVGSFFLVAKELAKYGMDLVVVDYSEDMLKEGRKRLSTLQLKKADLRQLPFIEQFDCVFIIGRVFTHMLSAKDVQQALNSISTSLVPGGYLFLDNYEDTKIEVTDYFNGTIEASDSSVSITRTSCTERISPSPYIVNWKAKYQVSLDNETLLFEDEILHRAFSRKEITDILCEHNFNPIEQGDNFDDTSFYTIAQKI